MLSICFFIGKSNSSSLEMYSAKLFNTIKDHNFPDALALNRRAYEKSLKDECSQRGFNVENVSVKRPPKPVKLVLKRSLADGVRRKIEEGLEKIRFCELDLQVVNKKTEDNEGILFKRFLIL